jgi:DNA repair protein RecO
MQPTSDLAIVLRSIAYEERHRIVTALTPHHGQISALARNAIQSRRFGGTLEIFAAADWLFTIKPGAELYHLTEAQIREPFEHLRKDFILLSTASVMNELMLKLAPRNEPSHNLFKLHSNALTALNELASHADLPRKEGIEIALLNTYLAKLLQWNGSQPQLHQCFQCKTSLSELDIHSELTCLISSAAWLCTSCRLTGTQHIHESKEQGIQQTLLRITPTSILDLHLSMTYPIRQAIHQFHASADEHRQLFRFLESLFTYHVPGFDQKPLKSLRFLDLA